ncbi:Uma2 family endonuclease [Streptacidiphilus sp. P02-A3a]|nr:Uma2 family endonuclease [Streptacidiphilus sp. P02-A3a]
MTWDELERLPDEIAEAIELWDGRVTWLRRPPHEHQQVSALMWSALTSSAKQRATDPKDDGKRPCWQVSMETNVFFSMDKNSFLAPDFLVRRCLERGADTFAADVSLVGEVLSRSDTPSRREWKMTQYAEAGIPWYWEVDLDSGNTWDVTAVRAYELALIQTDGLKVKPLRSAMYALVGEWSAGDVGIDFPEPFRIGISWDDLAL